MKHRPIVFVIGALLALLSALPVAGGAAAQTGTSVPAATPGATGAVQVPQAFASSAGPQVAEQSRAAGNTIYYTVRRGDTLARLAQRYGTTVAAIVRANPSIRNPNFIYPGQRLVIPLPVNVFTNVKVALIALNSGGSVGCGDSVVLVDRPVAPTRAPLTAAINELLSIKQRDYGQSGLTDILYASNLHVQNITITNGHANIWLTGNLSLGGECDDPRVVAQFEQTAKQFSTVQTVSVYINGVPLQTLLSGKGS
jgi:LysM repeat protein